LHLGDFQERKYLGNASFGFAQLKVSASLNSRSFSWLSEAETNGGGIFIPVNHLRQF
jgi:hypothetical protein